MSGSPPRSTNGISRPDSGLNHRQRSSSAISRPGTALSNRSPDNDISKTAVKVAVRVRPPLDESDPGYELIPHRFRGSTCQVTNPTTLNIQSAQGKKLFVFDRVFSDRDEQRDIWEYVSESVSSFVQGYNVSILAYGQSGAGKSYTMGTAGPGEQQRKFNIGIVPRAAASLFEKLNGTTSTANSRPVSIGSGLRMPKRYTNSHEASNSERNWQMKATYVEIYNEQLRDLLVPDTVAAHERSTVAIREDAKGRILLTGLQQVPINTVDDLMNALNFGSSIRQTDATAINSKSSRSHAVFSINLVQKKNKSTVNGTSKQFSTSAEAMNGSEQWVTIDSKLHFVDLAGSERLKNSGLTGERVREGISINAGLASLGKVISQLSSRSAGSHVSYRDSRLTRILQDSLGGDAITYMIACVNPVEFHLSETLNTVQYAQRARAIQSKPQIQQRAEDGDKQLVIDRLRSEVAFLREQIRVSERSERKNGNDPARDGRKSNVRENELQNQLLDVQENYSALSGRHAKLISEIAKSKGNDAADQLPALKSALGTTSSERLSRSSNFAEAVEGVVMEYEKTIQSLESSLSHSRSSLSTSESNLLEREAKLVYMEAVTSQLQSRVQKALDREANSETYLHNLERKLENASGGDDKHMIVIHDLRSELLRIRESESSAEEYISTLEERLAEAEQDTDIMQREIRRLEHVVERQRTVGKMDGLLHELDNLKHDDMQADRDASTEEKQHTPTDMFHDRLVATTSAIHPNGEMLPETAEEEWKSFGPMDGDEDDQSQSSNASEPEVAKSKKRRSVAPAIADKERLRMQAQSKATADKLETVTIELFELRVEHESTASELDDVSRKYQIALSTLAELQDAMDEARTRPSEHAEDGGARPSARMLSPDLSSRTVSPTLVEEAEHDGGAQEHNGPRYRDETLADSVRRLKRANAEKDINMAELTENFAQLSDQHQTTLKYVEELKEEVARAPAAASPQPQQHTIPSPSIVRRSVSTANLGKDRESRVFNSLRSLAVENFQGNPQAAQTFDQSISAAATESKIRNERIYALEADLTALRNEMDVKNQMIQGLTRERSVRTAPTMDMALVSSMRDHVAQSQKQIADLIKTGSAREDAMLSEIKQLKLALAKHADEADHVPGEVREASVQSGTDETEETQEEDADADMKQRQVLLLQQEVANWEIRHQETMSSVRESEHQLMATISGLETSLANAEALHAEQGAAAALRAEMRPDPARDLEGEKAKHVEQVTALQKEIDRYKMTAESHATKLLHLENSHAQILKEVEEDAKSRELTKSELQTHRSLVQTLEQQIEQQKSLSSFHQSGLRSLEESHANELDELRETLAAQQAYSDSRLNEQLNKHQQTTSGLREELKKVNLELADLMQGVSVAVNEEGDSKTLKRRLRSLADERTSMLSKHEEASKALDAVQRELKDAKRNTSNLETQVKELSELNEQSLRELEMSNSKAKKSSRMVQDLEEQLNSSFDHHQTTEKRLSSAHRETEKDLEIQRGRVRQLETQVTDLKRLTTSTIGRDSAQESIHDQSVAGAQIVRKGTPNPPNLPSPPPLTPLPPIPGAGDGATQIPRSPAFPRAIDAAAQVSPPSTPLPRPDTAALQAQTQKVEEQEQRIRTIEKHLFAEKQLTQTLEEALVDLETQANKTKADVEAWKKKCREVEEEATGLKRERGNMRNSLQAVEEERDRRIRAEAARKQLEDRMEQLGSTKRKKKQGTLNCF